MTAVPLPAIRPAPTRPRTLRTLAVLSDSVGVGIGDRAHTGQWRGFAPLLAQATGARLLNLSCNGARVQQVRHQQLPAALEARPDAAILLFGMNDTMRADFDPIRLRADLDHMISALIGANILVITIRYHDHGRVFPIPRPLRRLLASRIEQLNVVLDSLADQHHTHVVDLGRMPGVYHPSTWSIDRLHPSERGHRLLAHTLAARLTEAGVTVPREVALHETDGKPVSRVEHALWLLGKGVPWLCRRGCDLATHLARRHTPIWPVRRVAPEGSTRPA